MRRLTRARRGRGSTATIRGRFARLRDERGGIAVMLALLMPLLFGAAAIGIDTAAVWSARAQVRTGADAAVIAVAMDCAHGNCGDIKQTAEDAFWANDLAAKLSNLGPGEGWIAVNGRSISVTQKMPWKVNHFFAGALGQDTGKLSVSAYAQWAPAAKAVTEIPVAISYCTYQQLAGSLGSKTIVSLDAGALSGPSCRLNGRDVTGGIGLTKVDGSTCRTTTVLSGTYQRIASAVPSSCTPAYLGALVGKDVIIPVWDDASSTSFRVYGYAAFRVTGISTADGGKLTGYFTRSARQVGDTTPPATTAPDLGARSVFLTKN